ncbi:hypothetical protein BDV23DRAFT_153076 [Aspergillus alliaceus]|uniref:Uncharacterized protein n=1 Tax=Petromyces alliaceus TaxID=209559 RepID=A0A5N7CB92_PETAA|nr:hypothetical protein BDV23DRAFT_153076 [Aspergillus alliaceus]
MKRCHEFYGSTATAVSICLQNWLTRLGLRMDNPSARVQCRSSSASMTSFCLATLSTLVHPFLSSRGIQHFGEWCQ